MKVRQATTPEEACLFPGCTKARAAVGLCPGHYMAASRLVKQKKTTWKKLEAKGRIVRVMANRMKRNREWFLT